MKMRDGLGDLIVSDILALIIYLLCCEENELIFLQYLICLGG